MDPLSVIIYHFSVFSFEGKNSLESGNALIPYCGFKFCPLTHNKILKHGSQNFLLRECQSFFSVFVHRSSLGGDGETIENRVRNFGPSCPPTLHSICGLPRSALVILDFSFSTPCCFLLKGLCKYCSSFWNAYPFSAHFLASHLACGPSFKQLSYLCHCF